MCNHRLAVTQHYSSIHQDISQRHTGGALGSFVLGNLIGLNLEFFGHELGRQRGARVPRKRWGVKPRSTLESVGEKFEVCFRHPKSNRLHVSLMGLSQPLCQIVAQAK